MNPWKTKDELASPYGITQYLECPHGIMNMVFHLSPFRIQMRVFALRSFSLEKMRTPREAWEPGEEDSST